MSGEPKQKVIIHCRDGLDPEDAVTYVRLVMREGKISADGQSYCYLTTFPEIFVATRAPREGTSTYTFHVGRRR